MPTPARSAIEIEREADGRWIAERQALPGVLAYCATRAETVARAKALALRVLAERLEHCEPTRGRAWCAGESSRPATSGTGRRSDIWSRATKRAVYTDKGYDGWWYRQELARRGIAEGIMAGNYRQRPLEPAGHARNRMIGVIRAPVERTFAILKRWHGYGRIRYRSMAANALPLQLLALALNLRRALVLRG